MNPDIPMNDHNEQLHNPNMKTNLLNILSLTITAFLCLPAPSAPADPLQTLSGHVPAAVANLQPTGRPAATNRLHLAVALAPRNRDALEQLLKDQQDPQSASYHQYLSLEEFTKRFGPTQQDYQKALDFAHSNGLKVSGTYSNRIILDMEGAVPDVEKALHVTIRTYRHPTENREFYAPDTEPMLDLSVPLLNITGLDNYHVPARAWRGHAQRAHTERTHARWDQRAQWHLCASRPAERLRPGHDPDRGRSERRTPGAQL